jgi:hypothetical protein
MDFFLNTLLPALRDIAIVILAVESIVVGLIVLIVLIQVWKLVGAVRRHLDRLVNQASDVLSTTADTARNVKGTTTFVTDRATKPVIEALSVVTAAVQFARTALGDGGNENGRRS